MSKADPLTLDLFIWAKIKEVKKSGLDVRNAKAYELKASGYTWREIGAIIGLSRLAAKKVAVTWGIRNMMPNILEQYRE